MQPEVARTQEREILRIQKSAIILTIFTLSRPYDLTQRSEYRVVTEIIGLDHIYISVSDLARAEDFYDRVFPHLNFRKNKFAIDGDAHIQYYNRFFGYVLRPSRMARTHDSYAPGLHHLCFRVDTAADVREVADSLRAAGVDASPPQLFPEYADDYVATFFKDPDGLRLEITNYRAERRKRHDRWDDLA